MLVPTLKATYGLLTSLEMAFHRPQRGCLTDFPGGEKTLIQDIVIASYS